MGGDDALKGTRNQDIICGRGGDTLRGGRGEDRLTGGGSRDSLYDGLEAGRCATGNDRTTGCEKPEQAL